jgi:large subunit ribosomal protein L31
MDALGLAVFRTGDARVDSLAGPKAVNRCFLPLFSGAEANFSKLALVKRLPTGSFLSLCNMKADIHPKYQEAEIRCACGNVIKTRSTKPTILVGICNACHPFYTGTQKFVDTAGRVDKFQQRLAKTQAAQAATAAAKAKKKK